jgi:hypothetical protein
MPIQVIGTRRPDQFIVIDKQLNYNKETYPENI